MALDGRIDVGDQIVMVNNTSFEDLTDQEAIRLLREVAAAKRLVFGFGTILSAFYILF